MIRWAREHSRGYEVSAAGDKRFSALVARLKDGRTIEEAYQLDIKGYRPYSNDWRYGKGKIPIDKGVDLWREYLTLWEDWAKDNTSLIEDLYLKIQPYQILTDRYAWTEVSQARALAKILNDLYYPE